MPGHRWCQRLTLTVLASLLTLSATQGADQLVSRPAPQASAESRLAVGDKIVTGPLERRRVALPDGAVLYLNERTSASLKAPGQLELSAGEVFVEPADKAIEIATPKRKVRAEAARFGTRVDAAGTGVVVASGSVGVDDLRVNAGQGLTALGKAPTRQPRLASALAWLRDLRPVGALVAGQENKGGALVAKDPQGEETNLQLRHYHVDVHVEDGFARTTIEWTFFNHSHERLEGTFRFPLPPGASLSRLAMYVDGNLMEGGIAERDHARNVYETIRHERRDPALLEWLDDATLKMRIFPIEPRQEKRLFLSYTQHLPGAFGEWNYRFPAGDTTTKLPRWSLQIRVKGGANTGWRCESHQLQEKSEGADLLLSGQGKDVAFDRDIVLHLNDPQGGEEEQARFATAELNGGKYLLVRYRPKLRRAEGVAAARDWVVVTETGGDRDPLLMRTQIEVLRSFLGFSGRGDTLAVLTANTRTHRLHDAPVANSMLHIDESMKRLGDAHLIGALDLGKALGEAGPLLKKAKAPRLLHIGSGTPVLGETNVQKLLQRLPKGTRYVGIGVGRRWNEPLMRQMAEATGGHFTQINPNEPIGWRGLEAALAMDLARLVDVDVSDPDGKAVFLPVSRMVSEGEEVVALCRVLEGELPSKVRIRASQDGKEFVQVLEVKQPRDRAMYLPRTWARLEVERLQQGGEQNKKAIVELGKSMVLLTRYTSLLVLETDAMYQQFNVDRRGKDPWAWYAAPAKIKVVIEPPEGEDVKTMGKPSAKTVRNSVLVRQPTPLLARVELMPPVEKEMSEKRALSREKLEKADLPLQLALKTDRISDVSVPDSSAPAGIPMPGSMPLTPSPEIQEMIEALYARPEVPSPAGGEVSGRGKAADDSPPVPQLYQRPRLVSTSVFHNLTDLAPGLHGSATDIQAAFEAEARVSDQPRSGFIAPQAKKLLDAARKFGWRSFTSPNWTVTFDGSGQFLSRRVLESGLAETIACDDKTVRHLYPDLGLGGERKLSRAQRVSLAHEIPWLVPSAEDLARGADVSLVAANTVAIVPHASRDQTGKVQQGDTVHLIFAMDGRLRERRLISPDKSVAQRTVISEKSIEFQQPGRTRILAGTTADVQAPRFAVDTKDLVILSLPLRSDKLEQPLDRLTVAQAEQRLALFTLGPTLNPEAGREVFFSRLNQPHLRKRGHYVLLGASQLQLDADDLDVMDAFPRDPLARYLALHTSPTLRRHLGRWAVPEDTWKSGPLHRLAQAHYLCQRWSSPKLLQERQTSPATESRQALLYAKRYPDDELTWAVLSRLHERLSEMESVPNKPESLPAAWKDLATAYATFRAVPALDYSARYEAASCLFHAGEVPEARKQFRNLYARTLAAGAFPAIDSVFYLALRDAEKDGWSVFLRQQGQTLVKAGRRMDALRMADQTLALGDETLSRRLALLALDGASIEGEVGLKLHDRAIEAFVRTARHADADRVLRLLLADAKHGQRPELWSWAARVALALEDPARRLECLEKALDTQMAQSGEVMANQVGQACSELLAEYSGLAKSLRTLRQPPPAGLKSKVVRVADYWRSEAGQNGGQACDMAGDILRMLGDREFAWDYRTTPVAWQSGEAESWRNLATALVGSNERDHADRAFQAAFQRESTNPEILWQRADNLRQLGRLAEARTLFRQIAEGEWQVRFAGVKEQARQALED